MRDRGNDETGQEMGHMRLGKPNNLLQTQLTITWGNTRIEVNLCLVFPGGEDCQAHGFVDEPRRSYNQEVQDRGVPLLSRRFCTDPYFFEPSPEILLPSGITNYTTREDDQDHQR